MRRTSPPWTCSLFRPLALLHVLLVIRLERRNLVWINVTPNPSAEWVARQITEAFPWTEAPRYLIRDRDRVYGAAVMHRLRAMGIRDKPIARGSPWQNGFAERLIGSIRRECVDHVVVFGEAAPALDSDEVFLLLQRVEDPSVSRQRRSDPPRHPARGPRHICARPRRASSRLLQNLIFGTDNGQHGFSRCVYRNSDSHVVVMQSAEERMGANASDPLNWARDRRILSNDRCVLDAL